MKLGLRVSCLALLLLASCGIDNQRIIKGEDFMIANPEPKGTNFSSRNSKHKILMAVIDSGVDYNHPALQKSFHYTLDIDGKPTCLGYDFVGNDCWPGPYVIRTTTYSDYKDADGSGQSEESRQKALSESEIQASILSFVPTLSPFLNPRRHVSQEQKEATYHGTHVAGLMTYDRPDIGLLPYRVVPKMMWGEGNPDIMNHINDAIDRAVLEGARIINMSLGYQFDRTIDGTDDETAKKFIEDYGILDRITKKVQSYPNVLFVAASGNEGRWIDGNVKLQLPCGIDASNMLCVGALNADLSVASFSNLTLSGAKLVFALGANVLSTIPMDQCVHEKMEYVDVYEETKEQREAAETFQSECLKSPGYARLSGTSMASPIAARIAATIWIEKPTLTPEQLIEEMLARASEDRLGLLPIRKLKVDLPSWYSGHGNGQAGGEREKGWSAYTR